MNGDQTKSGYSKFTYRPFTLEGNFAFASGLQEMRPQVTRYTEIMPAVPPEWRDISFHQLRAEGAFLVCAEKANGIMTEIKITSEKSGKVKVKLPSKKRSIAGSDGIAAQSPDGYLKKFNL